MTESTPQLYRLAPHSPDDRRIVYKLTAQTHHSHLDCRFIYVLHTVHRIYVHIGERCSDDTVTLYWNNVKHLIRRIQTFEFASFDVSIVSATPRTAVDAESLSTTDSVRAGIIETRQNRCAVAADDAVSVSASVSRRGSESENDAHNATVRPPYDESRPVEYFWALLAGQPQAEYTRTEYDADTIIQPSPITDT